MNKSIQLIYLLISLTLLPLPTYAQQDESNLPIEIEADRLIAEEKTGISRYIKNALAIQGTLKIEGDQLEIHHPNREFNKLIATGNPAKFRRFIPEQNSWASGSAKTIIYYTNPRKIELITDGYAEQEGEHKITGDHIIYNLENQSLKAQSTQPNSRVKITLTPESKDSKASKENK